MSFYKSLECEEDLLNETTSHEMSMLFDQAFCFCNNQLPPAATSEAEVEIRYMSRNSRTDLIKWIQEVSRVKEFSRVTTEKAVYFLDKFVCSRTGLTPEGLCLVATATLCIASKQHEEEDYQFVPDEAVLATDRFSLHEVIQAERFVFDKISDILCAVTPDTLIQLFLKFVPDESERNELKRATEALMDAFILCHDFPCYLPSTIATCTVIIALASNPQFNVQICETVISLLDACRTPGIEQCLASLTPFILPSNYDLVVKKLQECRERFCIYSQQSSPDNVTDFGTRCPNYGVQWQKMASWQPQK